MQSPDVNVLVGAHRTDAVDHLRYKAFLEGMISHEDGFAVSDIVLSGFIRVVTRPGVFDPPSKVEEAFEFTDTILAAEGCVPLQSGSQHWETFSRLCIETNARGNLVTDAYFAALAIESGSEWVTMDGDYARFPGLKWRRPF